MHEKGVRSSPEMPRSASHRTVAMLRRRRTSRQRCRQPVSEPLFCVPDVLQQASWCLLLSRARTGAFPGGCVGGRHRRHQLPSGAVENIPWPPRRDPVLKGTLVVRPVHPVDDHTANGSLLSGRDAYSHVLGGLHSFLMLSMRLGRPRSERALIATSASVRRSTPRRTMQRSKRRWMPSTGRTQSGGTHRRAQRSRLLARSSTTGAR